MAVNRVEGSQAAWAVTPTGPTDAVCKCESVPKQLQMQMQMQMQTRGLKGEIPSYSWGKSGGTQAASKQSLNHSGYSCNIKHSRTLICPSFLTL